MASFFTADTHFNHSAVLRFANRPWTSADDMNEGLIEQWNSVVGVKDDIYFLGDFAFASKQTQRTLIKRLKGQKHLILGNHDKAIPQDMFKTVAHIKEVQINEQGITARVVMCHYAMRVWNQSHRGSWNLHGHSHGTIDSVGKQLDVGVDNAFKVLGSHRPFSIPEIAELISTANVSIVDGHQPKYENVY